MYLIVQSHIFPVNIAEDGRKQKGMIKSSIKSLFSRLYFSSFVSEFYFDFPTLHSILRHFPLSFETHRYFRFKFNRVDRCRYKKYPLSLQQSHSEVV